MSTRISILRILVVIGLSALCPTFKKVKKIKKVIYFMKFKEKEISFKF